MDTVSIRTIDVKENFSEVMNRVSQQKERILLTRRGVPIAALISIEDFKRLESNQDQEDLQDAIDALNEAREAGCLSLDELQKQLR